MAAFTTVKNPGLYFNTVLYTGNGSNGRAITGVGHQPDLVWIKNRDATEEHLWYDAVRGADKLIRSNNTAADATTSTTTYFNSFDSDGFTIGQETGMNANGQDIVAWNWKAGTTGSGTTGGSGTSKAYTYSVSTTAGFSIIRYLGNQTAGHEIPHHLADTPKFIIVKNLADTRNWNTYHHSQGATKYMVLNNNDAEATSASLWNDTSPTSSNIILGSGQNVNQTDSAHVAYCFAEKRGYTKFGSYTGNGNANGTFIYTGFKPAFVIVKCTSHSGESWWIGDNKRPGYNVNQKALLANSTSAEVDASYQAVDFVSNGIKWRGTNDRVNANAKTYILMAFADEPLVGDNPATAF